MVTGEPERQTRVFGIARSTNIPAKYVSDMTITKTRIVVPHRKPKSIRVNQPPFDTSTKIQSTDKKSPENVSPRRNKNSDSSPQRVVGKLVSKSEVSVTPLFYTAAQCSKCRFDKFETSYYWIGQNWLYHVE
ncbi:unnamed protein product [Lupinus luteus]|uniref:Uncharacterized protein n=1 Tax=Lupinus luteus TaxID=3873 RepID=A0AAV1Y4X3_LUPLU